ncbi:MAG TPA: carbohydrate ABC transporter permease [Phototrophicaceae bacterium]|nr:carbohydrate ABC transporter permease [Phototrophicaceae bacterium]
MATYSTSAPVENRVTMRLVQVALYVILIVAAFLSLVPFYWMIMSSFKPLNDILTIPVTVIPPHFTLDNYTNLLTQTLFLRSILNTLVVAGSSVILQVFLCSLAGFAFAKYRFRGRNLLFTLVLGTVMIPVSVQLVPNYILMAKIGWLNTLLPLIIPTAANAFGIFWMRQYMYSVPDELLDAGRLDGASEFGLYWRIVVPVVRPALSALALFVFTTSWNDFLLPLVYLRSQETFTVQLMIDSIFRVRFQQNFDLLMSASVLAVIPMTLLFFTLQQQFVAGLTLGSVKE